VSAGQTATSYQPPTLQFGTTYFWRVDSIGVSGTTIGTVWSFTTAPAGSPPAAPTNPVPSDAATGVATSVGLSWTAASGATAYDVSFGTTNSPPRVSAGQTATSYQPSTLQSGTTYFWRVDSIGDGGTTIGTVWSFTTAAAGSPPGAPTNPVPTNGATGVATSINLSWTAASGATGYDVAFGANNPPPRVTSNQTATGYAPGTLSNSTTYFWQVTARNSNGTTSGPMWSFTTAPADTGGGGATALRRLKVLTWNIQHGTDYNGADAVDAQVALMADLNPDVIGLQEVDINSTHDLSTLYKSKLEALTGVTWNTVWAPAPYPPGTNPEGNLILTRLPVFSSATTQWDVVPTDPSWLGAKRSAAMVDVIVNNTHVKVFITHLDTDATNRHAQLLQLLDWTQTFSGPRIIGGDFNMMPSESDYSTMAAQFPDTWATLVNAYQASPGPDQGYTKDVRTIAPFTGQPGRIDYWFHESSAAARPTEVGVFDTHRSDHHALLLWVAVQ
jgi:endonuclease/exonuclease/phosphatase family metal-dependent hydrolase